MWRYEHPFTMRTGFILSYVCMLRNMHHTMLDTLQRHNSHVI